MGGMPDLESPWPARGNYPIWVWHTKNLHHMSNTYFLTKSYLRRIVFSYDFKDCKREKLCFEFVISPMIAIPRCLSRETILLLGTVEISAWMQPRAKRQQ